ncbi:hypothetical protein B0H63DRAFT_99256 [Podospora didyma]|uniref:DNA mismatch repair protein HSM3 N-terminal domain-containing protein n=1 Tax=Podospora didyma TaxID=330526 RepID=A0AAE0NXC7_9PEZI|nr:hypothetical protein B0H63DRAFT_99256 [Podospora didyma]
MELDTTPISGLDELDRHLDDLVQDPTLPLNAKLFDDVELQLTETNIPPIIPRFLPRLTIILKQYTGDPTILASLAIKLLGPVSFTQILSLASEESLIQALDSPAPAANLLAMTVLHKAAASPGDAALLSAMAPLVASFIRRWLAAPQVEVGQKGGKVLGDLLDVDCELPPPPPGAAGGLDTSTEIVLRKSPGQGKMWRRVFADRGIYALLVALCAGRHADTSNDEHQQSLAQGRVLRVLPRLAALNLQAVSRSEFPASTSVRKTNGHASSQPISSPRQGEGLLQFAALRMVDKNDMLMHLSLVDFFEAFVTLMRVTEHSSYKVDTVRAILAQATADDAVLKEALLTLPERIIQDEADDVRRWLREVMPGEAIRVALR